MLEDSITKALGSVVGADNVLGSAADREFFSTDIYRKLELAGAVVRPETAEQVQAIVRLAGEEDLSVFVRGGGASYTDAYTPSTPRSILIDMSAMDAIIEINEEDMYVTVEPGVTWNALNEALTKSQLRTPFWGPFSGLAATVGGSVSQHTLSHGSGINGISAESVVSMDIVLASGELLKTGSAAHQNMPSPFYRFSGPDLVGLFTGDAGALGVKTAITLRLIKRRPDVCCESFSFETFSDLQKAMSEVGRAELADENFGLDPTLQDGQIARQNNSEILNTAWRVFRSSSNPVSGLVTLLKMATAGRSFLKKGAYSAHFILDGVSKAEARAKADALREICMKHGVIVPNTVPTVVTAMPFAPLYNVLGPAGERWVPIHGILPHSKASAFHDAFRALIDESAEQMQAYKVKVGGMFSTISTNAFLYEIAFYWEDERNIFHNRILPEEFLSTLPKYEPSAEARAYVEDLKGRCVDLFGTYGSIHFQLGKAYPFLSTRRAETGQLIVEIKQSFDPKNILNPGALGLAKPPKAPNGHSA